MPDAKKKFKPEIGAILGTAALFDDDQCETQIKGE